MRKMTAIRQSAPKKKKQRVAAYCRVSTDRTEQQHSFEMQRMYFEKNFADSETSDLVEIYTDTTSGTSALYRPGFQRMMSDCRAGKIDRIVTKSLSRFARNTKECLTTLREMKKLGVTLHFKKEGIDTANVSDEIMITIMEGLAQEEAASISRNVRWSLKRRMANGTLGIARVPYGYKKVDGALLIEEKQAEVIKRIFSLYLSGTGAKAIAVLLNDDNIPSPTGTKWNNVTVLKILRQEKYIGDIRWQKTYSIFMGEKWKINHGEQESYYIRNCLPPIISREDFIVAQQLAFYTDTMLYILKQYEEELNFKLLSQEQRNDGFRYKFNIAAVLRGDTKSQLESLSMGVSNGVYTPNEARRNLDLPALPGGDRIYFNGSNIAVEDAGIQYREQEQDSSEKTLLRLTEAIEKAVECGIIDLRKGGNSDVDYIQNPSTGRMEGSRPSGGGSSGSSGGSSSGGVDSPKKRLKKMIDDGDVTLKINEIIQNRHYKGTKEYNDFLKKGVEKSYFTVSQSKLQDFLYKNATKGKIFISSAGDVKERFDFEKPVAFDTVLKRETTWATVSYSKKRTHFSPYSPMPKE